ncbi:MAG: hypothetical protein C4K48_10270 [Candidatus Thorarchaeota archaeon]|nr:MAG: hypothetical protein C4K48_10270 [Candidatus Thorarchaeota archaeon]
MVIHDTTTCKTGYLAASGMKLAGVSEEAQRASVCKDSALQSGWNESIRNSKAIYRDLAVWYPREREKLEN